MTAPMTQPTGPTFQRIEEVPFAAFEQGGHIAGRRTPLLVKGAVRHWPAWDRWSFDHLADLCEDRPEPITARFQTGLTEQGATRQARHLPVAPYLRELGRQAVAQGGNGATLAPYPPSTTEVPGQRFTLDWSRMNFTPDRLYLQQWDMLAALPALRRDFPLRRLWPGGRLTWEYVFMGPANTLSGLHFDFPNNWFCQVRGTKEFILFGPEQTPHLSVARKYDWGATLSEVDIARLDQQPAVRDRFARAHGIYARVEAGDALYIPRRTWHAVVSLTPSISIGIFGLTPFEVATGGSLATIQDGLHRARLYRWGHCTCHPARPSAA
ncbi:MAG: cupin-like domain-containing protein [Ramlibacter sp.]|nr:cupin-like domain-containing protein [Ramlibacter sp.]